jgi:FkbM family methyltransferase
MVIFDTYFNFSLQKISLKALPKQLITRTFVIFKILIHSILSMYGFSGAKLVGKTDDGNSYLKLNKNCALGYKGSTIELPRDQTIYKYIKLYGYWEIEEANFLAKFLKKLCENKDFNVAFLDIGANTGLVTLQTMNIANTDNSVFLFEPIPRHVSAIKHNLRGFSNIYINNFALSSKNGRSKIYTQINNHGNTSLIKSLVPSNRCITTSIKLVDTKQYFHKNLNKFDKYVIKSDTQGMDALILSRIPKRVWQNTECAVIEVAALPEINKIDVDDLLLMFNCFEIISWYPNLKQKISLKEISEFWLSRSGSQRNLFLSRI